MAPVRIIYSGATLGKQNKNSLVLAKGIIAPLIVITAATTTTITTIVAIIMTTTTIVTVMTESSHYRG